jgi:hypothetical protein
MAPERLAAVRFAIGEFATLRDVARALRRSYRDVRARALRQQWGRSRAAFRRDPETLTLYA